MVNRPDFLVCAFQQLLVVGFLRQCENKLGIFGRDIPSLVIRRLFPVIVLSSSAPSVSLQVILGNRPEML